MNNRYELTLIVNPNESEESANALIEKVAKAINDNNGKIVDTATWGIKKFAAPIKKLDRGYYFFLQFDIEPAMTEKVAWIYRFERSIIRFLLVNLTTDKTYFKQMDINKLKAKEKKERQRRDLVAEASKGAQIDINMALPAKEAAKKVEVKQAKAEAKVETVPETPVVEVKKEEDTSEATKTTKATEEPKKEEKKDDSGDQ